MRTATNIIDKATGTYGYGNNQKPVTGTVNKIAIDNYGSITVQAFNQRLAQAGVLGWSFFTTKKHTIWTDEYLTKCINENSDLFPAQF